MAGVTLGLIIGQGGLIQRAKRATNIWQMASTNESEELDGALNLINLYGSESDYELVKKYFIGKYESDVVDNTSESYEITFLDDENSITDASKSLKYVRQTNEENKDHIYIIYKNILYEAITEIIYYDCVNYWLNNTDANFQKLSLSQSQHREFTYNSAKFEEVKMLGSIDDYVKKQLKIGTISFINNPNIMTCSDVKVNFYINDFIVQEKVLDGTYFIVSSLNDVKKLTTITSPVTEQIAQKNGDTIYACLTDGKGNYSAIASETINNIDRTEYKVTYNLDGGEITGQKTTYNADNSFTLPIPTKKGYAFMGWTGSNGTTPEVKVKVGYGSIGDRNYTANWEVSLPGSTIAKTKAPKISVNGLKYADIDNDGTADGIIVADISKDYNDKSIYRGGNPWFTKVPWKSVDEDGKAYSNFSYTKKSESELNSYKEDKSYEYENPDGSKVTGTLIQCTDKTKNNPRYYIISLADFDTNKYYWYYNAYNYDGNKDGDTDDEKDKMYDYENDTKGDFGAGKDNTNKMITAWNNKKYGDQAERDLWKIIQDKVKEGWFIPSRAEWAAFGSYLNASFYDSTTTYYPHYGLSNYYWSSTQEDNINLYVAKFGWTRILDDKVNEENNIRLAKTF